MPLPTAAQKTVAALAAGDNPGRLSLNVEGIHSPHPPGVVYEVHLNLPPDADPTTNDTFFVGQISFFGSGHHPPGQQSATNQTGLSHTFDITGLVQLLHAQHRWDPQQATVTFVPVGLTPPPGQPGSAYDTELTTTPRVGRISLSSTP
ncbi:MAG: hypothetical protein ACRDRS_18845 [Pseudonocardiaceae bacterium]